MGSPGTDKRVVAAEAAWSRGEFAVAAQLFQELATSGSGSEFSHRRVDCLIALGDTDNAMQALLLTLESSQINSRAVFQQITKMHRTAGPEVALKLLSVFLQRRGPDPYALRMATSIAEAANDLEKALEFHVTLACLSDSAVEFRLDSARKVCSKGNEKQIVSVLAALEQFHIDVTTRHELIVIAALRFPASERLGKLAEIALQSAPLLQQPFLELAQSYATHGRYRQASVILRDLKSAAALNMLRKVNMRLREQRRNGELMAITPVLVTGTMRSGTTLISRLLQRLGQTSSAHGIYFESDADTFLHEARIQWGHRHGRADPWEEFSYNPAHVANLLGIGEESPTPTEGAEALNRHFIDEILFRLAPCFKPSVVGCKATVLVREIELFLLGKFSQKAIITVRDPRDVLASHIVRQRFTRRHIEAYSAWLTLLAYDAFEPVIQNDERVKFVRYEDLVSTPRESIPDLCRFIGLEVMSSAQLNTILANVDSNSSYERPAASQAGIYSESVGAFRKHLSPADIWMTEQLCGSYMQRHGYASVSRLRRPAMEAYLLQTLREVIEVGHRLGYSVRPLVRRATELGWRRLLPRHL